MSHLHNSQHPDPLREDAYEEFESLGTANGLNGFWGCVQWVPFSMQGPGLEVQVHSEVQGGVKDTWLAPDLAWSHSAMGMADQMNKPGEQE